MTDITELAQQELAQLRAELSNQAIGSKDHLRKIALSLVDKLEKYRDREIRWLALSDEKSKIITDQEEALEKAQETIAFQQGEIKALLSSLESRTATVKLPKKNIGWDRDEDDCWNNAIDACAEALTEQGIKWEAE
ncbi:hypothetical protein [Klebsiella aerogenes]|uniref:hypothetical protein n=1 Tax=Klebsiella aerogenes TaxID=548 RepID=UPI000AF7E6AB|nr:hypothetical protein [Klebsiella aerogenes]